MSMDPERLWKGVCVLEELKIVHRTDGKRELVLVIKEGGARSLERFLRRGAARQGEGGSDGD
jgi:hypothetical protein